MLYVMIGEPGHGKSFVSDILSRKTGAKKLQSDVIRKEEIANGEPTYSSDESHKTYQTLFEYANDELESGRDVILDATFNRKNGRKRAKNIAENAGVNYILIYVECDEKTAKKRIRNRSGVSDADVELYENFRLCPIEENHIVIDNSGSKSNTIDQIDELLNKIN